jgi:hypothetical protein
VCVVGIDQVLFCDYFVPEKESLLLARDLHRSFDTGLEMDHLRTNAEGILNFLCLCLVVLPFPSILS